MIKRFEQFCFALIILFAIVGSVVTGTVLHEYSHALDFREFSEDSEICALVLPQSIGEAVRMDEPLGYFRFTYDVDLQDEVDEAGKYTEEKAYLLTAVPIILVGMAVVVMVVFRYDRWRFEKDFGF
jgi:hypothetical protein